MKSNRRRMAAPPRDAQVLTALRLPPALLARADRLRPALAAELGVASRTTVLRAALMRGLDALEAEYK
jgi:hypothetical protein